MALTAKDIALIKSLFLAPVQASVDATVATATVRATNKTARASDSPVEFDSGVKIGTFKKSLVMSLECTRENGSTYFKAISAGDIAFMDAHPVEFAEFQKRARAFNKAKAVKAVA